MELLELVEAHYELNGRRSLRRLRHARKPLLAEFGHDLALDLARLEDYVARRRRDRAALAPIQYELAILRRGFTLAVRRQLLPYRPAFPVLPIDDARQGFFEREGFDRVRAALPEPLWNVVTFRLSHRLASRTFPFDVLPELKEVLERQRCYTQNSRP